jgi:hypothetical protein
MVLYFSTYIPFYSWTVAPLFNLLKKGICWTWNSEHTRAFDDIKIALGSAPVLGHPMNGMPYRLYTDALDFTLGCYLQQVQKMTIGDLKYTKIYAQARSAFDQSRDVPIFVTRYNTKKPEFAWTDSWASDFDDTSVTVERVITYWSCMLKSAKCNYIYSATEREALAAKEGLVHFQPLSRENIYF